MDIISAYREVGTYRGAAVISGTTHKTVVVVPAAEYVRFAGHYGFRPDFCEAADPESKGIAGNVAGYAKGRPDGGAGAVR